MELDCSTWLAQASRPSSVQINTTKQFWFWGSSVFTAPSGAHICLKMRICVHIPVGYSGSLSTVNETCNKTKDTVQTKLSVHIFQVHPHIKFGCTLVRLTWEDHLSSLFHCEEFDERTNITGLTVLVCCTFNELRGSSPGCQMHLDQVTVTTCSHHVFEFF